MSRNIHFLQLLNHAESLPGTNQPYDKSMPVL